MIVFGVMVLADSEAVSNWFRLLNNRLRNSEFHNLYFRGGVHALKKGVYAVAIEPQLPMLLLLCVSFFLVLGGFFLWMNNISIVGWLLMGLGWVVMGSLVLSRSRLFFLVIVWLQVWRLTGRFRCLRIVTDELFAERIVYGTK